MCQLLYYKICNFSLHSLRDLFLRFQLSSWQLCVATLCFIFQSLLNQTIIEVSASLHILSLEVCSLMVSDRHCSLYWEKCEIFGQILLILNQYKIQN